MGVLTLCRKGRRSVQMGRGPMPLNRFQDRQLHQSVLPSSTAKIDTFGTSRAEMKWAA